MALAFIAFFGLVVVAVLGVADLTGLGHINSESTATKNSLSEGGAAYGAADAGRPDVALTCNVNDTGTLTMQGGDQAQYTVRQCGIGAGVGSGPGPGPNCLLCILNVGGSPATTVLDAKCAQCTTGLVTTGGDDYLNGSITSNTSFTAQASAGPPVKLDNIRLFQGASDNGCACTPTPTHFGPKAIADPLRCGGPAPACAPTSAVEPQLCTTSANCTPDTLCHSAAGATWSPTLGCSITLNSTQATLGPGLWDNISVAGNPSTAVTFDDASGSPGVYVLTGAFSVTGNSAVGGSDVIFYLACTNYTSTGQPCSGTGGSVSFGGNGTTTLSAPTGGPYAGIAVLSDPALPDPGGAGSCRGGVGCIYTTAGNGAAVTGTIDTRSGGMAIGGNAGQTISSGRLITNSLFMSVSGHAGSGLALTAGPGFGGGNGSCGVYDFTPVTGSSVAGGSYGGAGSSTGRAVVQSQCNTTFDSGSGASVTYAAGSLTDSSRAWTTDQWKGATVLAGSGTVARVAGNDAHTLTLTANWISTPSAGTSYNVSLGTGVIYFNYLP